MKPRSVVIGLLSDRVDLVVWAGGRAVAARRLPITLGHDPCDWAKAVRDFGGIMKQTVGELNIQGLASYVLYRSPTQAADLVGLKVRAASQAIEAAQLSCLDSLPYSAMSAVCEAAVVGRDAVNDERETHVVVTAERDDIAGAIAQMVEVAGLRFVAATPMDAAIFASMVQPAMQRNSSPQGFLYLGEHSSVFLVAGGGKLHFGRRIGLGLESLVHSLTRPIRRDVNGEQTELDLVAARKILHRHGIPARDTIVHEQRQLTGGDLIPLLQPVLQRFIVELRQSIRFGLPEEQRTGLSIRLTGPGCHLTGVAELIGGELGAEVKRDADWPAYDWTRPDSPGGELCDAASDRRMLRRLNLQPQEMSRRRRTHRLRRWMWTGAAAALSLIAFDAMRYHFRLQSAHSQADVLAVQCADVDALRATGERLLGAVEAMNELEKLVVGQTSSATDFAACMKELSRLTPETVRFTNVRFYQANGQNMAAINGYAFAPDAGGERTGLEEFVDALNASPMFDNVVLGAVQIGEADSLTGQRFEVGFRGVPAPPAALQGLTAASEETGP